MGIGTYDKLVTLSSETHISEVVELFLEHKISAIPVVDSRGILLDVYEKYDLMILAKDENLPNLELTVREALLSRSEVSLWMAQRQSHSTV